MLAVISDLHFEEERTDAIADPSGGPPLTLERNIPARAFGRVFAGLADAAIRNEARSLDFVLSGDVFDLHRTSLWFREDRAGERLRPWVACGEVVPGGPLEAKVLAILDAIAVEPLVGETLELLRMLSSGRYCTVPDDPESVRDFPVPVALHFLPGNHDRLANATPAIRRRVRELLGMPPSDAPFPHVFRDSDPRVLVRHGHEYDRFNFSLDLERRDPFPSEIPDAAYDAPCLGDFLTVEIASRLTVLFREIHGDEAIAGDPVLRQVYLRLLAFDDVRPQARLVPFLLQIPRGPAPEIVWAYLRPVARRLLEGLGAHPYLDACLTRLGHGLASAFLRSGLPRIDFVLDRLRPGAARLVSAGSSIPVEEIAAREEAVRRGEVRFVIAGHTHAPQVAIVSRRDEGGESPLESWFVDTGTWRSRVVLAGSPPTSGRVKTLTHVTVYSSTEDGASRGRKTESFDFWTGYTQKW